MQEEGTDVEPTSMEMQKDDGDEYVDRGPDDVVMGHHDVLEAPVADDEKEDDIPLDTCPSMGIQTSARQGSVSTSGPPLMSVPFNDGVDQRPATVRGHEFFGDDDSSASSNGSSSPRVKRVKREILLSKEKVKVKGVKLEGKVKKEEGDKDLKGKSTSTSRSAKAGLIFPVGRMTTHMKSTTNVARIGSGAPVYLASVLEYLCAEILELAGNSAIEQKKQRILPRHIQLAISNDEELHKYLGHATIASGGVRPNINAVLLKRDQ